MELLTFFVIALFLIVVLGFFNEKKAKLTYEISLMLFSVVIGGLIVLFQHFFPNTDASKSFSAMLDALTLSSFS